MRDNLVKLGSLNCVSRAVEISPGVPLVSAALKCTVAKAAGDGDDVSDHPTLNSFAFAK
jgi:hypothetical protein